MKLSEWIKDHDKDRDSELKGISSDDLLSITHFDNQPERSKREDIQQKTHSCPWHSSCRDRKSHC